MKLSRKALAVAVAATALLAVSCAKKKVAAAAPPPPAQPAAHAASQPSPAPAPSAAVAAPEQQATSRYPDAATRARIDELLKKIQDAYFDYDKHFLREDAQKALLADGQELAEILRQYPDYKITVEGHCDERGSDEYNLALGDARATAARDYLVTVGVSADQVSTISYGKQRPVCSEHDEACWQKNRRVHLVAMAQ